jgi:hypothetical protein
MSRQDYVVAEFGAARSKDAMRASPRWAPTTASRSRFDRIVRQPNTVAPCTA